MNDTKMVLVCVDTQNLYYSSRSIYGEKARIDFRKLKNNLKQSTNAGFIRPVAFISTNKIEDSRFMKFLKKIGYAIEHFSDGNAISQIKSYLNDFAKDYDIIVVCSGHGDLVEVYKDLVEAGKEIIVLSFADSLNKEIEKVAKVEFLNMDILMSPVRKPEEETEEIPEAAQA
jgi:uncharacterized LabA/DUF88 family protein